jgi:competence protein ComEA
MLSRLMTRREQLVVGFLALSIAAGAAALLWTQRSDEQPAAIEIQRPIAPPQPSAPAPTMPEASPPRLEVVVSVQGAVITPGVYRLDDGSRVADLIRAAGGLLGADTSDINLAARLIDGTTLTIPERVDESFAVLGEDVPVAANPAAYTISGQGSVPSQMQPGAATGTGRIHLNRATQAELETLPGIGPKLAQQIIQYRESGPFKSVDALQDVPGIGPQRFEAIRDLITVE